MKFQRLHQGAALYTPNINSNVNDKTETNTKYCYW